MELQCFTVSDFLTMDSPGGYGFFILYIFSKYSTHKSFLGLILYFS